MKLSSGCDMGGQVQQLPTQRLPQHDPRPGPINTVYGPVVFTATYQYATGLRHGQPPRYESSVPVGAVSGRRCRIAGATAVG